MRTSQAHTHIVRKSQCGNDVGPCQDWGLDMLQHWLPIICQSIKGGSTSTGIVPNPLFRQMLWSVEKSLLESQRLSTTWFVSRLYFIFQCCLVTLEPVHVIQGVILPEPASQSSVGVEKLFHWARIYSRLHTTTFKSVNDVWRSPDIIKAYRSVIPVWVHTKILLLQEL